MTSYGCTNTNDANEITHHVDVSWNQSWTGTDQKRVARFDGNRVYLSTPPSLDPITGTMSMRTMTWEKLGRSDHGHDEHAHHDLGEAGLSASCGGASSG